MKEKFKGILFCFILAIPAWFLGKAMPVIGGPVFAILLGMVLTLIIPDKSAIEGGIKFTSKKILQAAVVLLGFGMNFHDILLQGKQSLPIILCTISTSLLVSYILCKALKMDRKISTLIGVGSSICGGSAIAATAPVINADDEEVAQSISVIFFFNILAALIFPTLGGLLGFSDEGFGLFAGTAINDTSSVTAAAAAWDGIHGTSILDIAAIVKLTRTLAIIPITLILALVTAKQENRDNHFQLKKVFPLFVLFFLLAAVATTLFHLPPEVTDPLKTLSRFLIVMAMGAIGMNTNIVKLIKTGGRPIFMGFCCWISISLVSFGMQHLLGYF